MKAYAVILKSRTSLICDKIFMLKDDALKEAEHKKQNLFTTDQIVVKELDLITPGNAFIVLQLSQEKVKKIMEDEA